MKNLTYGALKKMVQEALNEANCTVQGGAAFKAGEGENYATPKAFKSGVPFSKRTERPKRPSHTKMFDFLEEEKIIKEYYVCVAENNIYGGPANTVTKFCGPYKSIEDAKHLLDRVAKECGLNGGAYENSYRVNIYRSTVLSKYLDSNSSSLSESEFIGYVAQIGTY